MTTAFARSPKVSRTALLVALPLLFLLLVGLLEASGTAFSPNAGAATTSNVVVTATSGANISVTNGCSNAASLTVSLGTIAYSSSCAVTYGATNDATQKLTLEDNDGAAPFQGTIPNTTSDCAALTGASDNAGVHIVATANNSAVSASWATSCTATATAGTNLKFRSTPATAVDACTSSVTSATNHSCTFEWGVMESGSDLASGSYAGTAKFTVVDI